MKNRTIRIHLIPTVLVVILCLSACSKKKKAYESPDTVIVEAPLVYTPNDTFPSSMLDTVSWIPLGLSDANGLREITKLTVVDGKVILNDRIQGGTQVYDFLSGKLLYVIDKKGNGPGEYLETAAFTVTPTSVYVLDNYSHAILRYSLADGSFIEKKPVSFVAWDMEAYDDDTFLFTCLNNNPNSPKPPLALDYAVWQTDGDFNVTEKYFPVEDDYAEIYGKRRYFTRDGSDIVFHAFRYDGYFNFAKDRQPVFYPVEFPNPIPEGMAVRLADLENKTWQYLSSTPFISGDYAVVRVTDGNEGMQRFAGEGKIFENSNNRTRNMPIDIVGVTDNNRFIGYINDNYDMYSSLVKFGFQKGDEAVENLLRQGGCCLIVYQMKAE